MRSVFMVLMPLLTLCSCSKPPEDYYEMGRTGSFFSADRDTRLILDESGDFVIASERSLAVEQGRYRFDGSRIYFTLSEGDLTTLRQFSCLYRVEKGAEKSELFLKCEKERHKLPLSPHGVETRFVNSVQIKIQY